MEAESCCTPVTDEALTQCIKTLRRKLGDDAGRPRFIETAPKHGYRFIAPVTSEPSAGAAVEPTGDARSARWLRFFLLASAGMGGGGLAGLIGGLIYGFVGASQPQPAGAASVFLVLVCLTMAVGLLGGAGVGAGIAAGLARAAAVRGPAKPCSALLIRELHEPLAVSALCSRHPRLHRRGRCLSGQHVATL